MTVMGRLRGRVERLEARLSGVSGGRLTPAEQDELARLEQEQARRFPEPIDTWDAARLDEFVAYQAQVGGPAQRLDELRQRARTPEERRADEERVAQFARMSRTELDAWAEARARDP